MDIKTIIEHAQDGYPLTQEMIDFLANVQQVTALRCAEMAEEKCHCGRLCDLCRLADEIRVEFGFPTQIRS